MTSKVVQSAPSTTGLYIFRKANGKKFGRLNGESDIIYIGSATGGSGIKGRLGSHMNPGPSQQTNLRSRWLRERIDIEVAWAEDPGASPMEDDLLIRYQEEHWELPPMNRAVRGPWGRPEV
jgi:hypothetical protein